MLKGAGYGNKKGSLRTVRDESKYKNYLVASLANEGNLTSYVSPLYDLLHGECVLLPRSLK
jgi:hypothetical protein